MKLKPNERFPTKKFIFKTDSKVLITMVGLNFASMRLLRSGLALNTSLKSPSNFFKFYRLCSTSSSLVERAKLQNRIKSSSKVCDEQVYSFFLKEPFSRLMLYFTILQAISGGGGLNEHSSFIKNFEKVLEIVEY